MLDTTIIIPYKETPSRKQAFETVYNYLRGLFPDVPIIVGGTEGTDGFFHRTKIINNLMKQVKTKYVINHDADIITDRNCYIDGTILLKHGYDLVIPHSLMCYQDDKMLMDNAMGGIVMHNLARYKDAGMENENLKEWYFDDFERIYRSCILGHMVYINGRVRAAQQKKFKIFPETRIPYYDLKHIKHDREAVYTCCKKANKAEMAKVAKMTKEELISYIDTWGWNR